MGAVGTRTGFTRHRGLPGEEMVKPRVHEEETFVSADRGRKNSRKEVCVRRCYRWHVYILPKFIY